MLIRQDQPATVQTASVIHEIVVCRAEHIDIHRSKIQILKPYPSFICIIKIQIFSGRDLFSPRAFTLLPILTRILMTFRQRDHDAVSDEILPLKVNARNGYFSAMYL